jgi:preprotein translocase subunit YajC
MTPSPALSFALVPVLAQDTAPAPATPGGQPNPLTSIMPIVLMFVIFYFILIRPQRKRQKELAAQIEALRSGDKVVTSGGIHGLVTNIKERTVILKVAEGTKMEFEKSAVQAVIKKSDRPEKQEDADAEEPDGDNATP